MDVASIIEAGFHPKMHCNDFPPTHAGVVYSTAFRRKGYEQRGPKLLFPDYLIVPRCPQRLELPLSSECPINPQHYHYQNLCTLCPSIM